MRFDQALQLMVVATNGPSPRFALPYYAAGTFLFMDNYPDADLNGGTPTFKLRQWTGGGGSWNAPDTTSGSAADYTIQNTDLISPTNGIPVIKWSRVG